jgi:hypothetical protein
MRTPSWPEISLALCLTGLAALRGYASPGRGAPVPDLVLQENWEARTRLASVIFAPVREAAAAPRRILSQEEGASNVLFQADRQSGFLYLVFANGNGKGSSLDAAGTFIIKRSLKDGSFLQAKIFVQDGPGSYVRLFPGEDGSAQEDRSLMDVYLFGEPFQTRVPLPVSFTRLLTAPLSTIMQWSAAVVDWALVCAPSPGPADAKIEQVVRVLQERLPGLRDMDDGAMDAAGRMVFIANGALAGKGGFNCSGFAKWVVDGFYAPLTGKAMDIESLKSRNAGQKNTWSARFEEELDPWFGLDWSRGLARTVFQARTGVIPSDEQIDVRDDGRLPSVRDVGYPVARLEYLLYFLARSNPGTFYVGSVNAPSARAVSDGTPTLRQHHHLIVLFPYFDQAGRFQVAVMERNVRTGLPSLLRRYGGEYVHLVRISSEGIFAPPRIE